MNYSEAISKAASYDAYKGKMFFFKKNPDYRYKFMFIGFLKSNDSSGGIIRSDDMSSIVSEYRNADLVISIVFHVIELDGRMFQATEEEFNNDYSLLN